MDRVESITNVRLPDRPRRLSRRHLWPKTPEHRKQAASEIEALTNSMLALGDYDWPAPSSALNQVFEFYSRSAGHPESFARICRRSARGEGRTACASSA